MPPVLSNLRWALHHWKKALAAIALLVALAAIVALDIYLKLDRAVSTVQHIGTLEAIHQSQGKTGSSFSVLFVRLASNELVNVTPMEMTPFTRGARVKIIETKHESGKSSYAFVGYVDAASNPTVHTDSAPAALRR